MPPVGGIRIAWDNGTLKKVSAAGGGGYARMIKLHDKSLICVYEAGGSTVCVKSTDDGRTWSAQATVIAPRVEGVSMAVPDILELKDHSLLVGYNPRPGRGADTSKHFGIKTKKSYDGGLTWTDERTIYQADNKFDNGCWEPAAIQLPNGEIQLYFANESPYRKSNEQEISMLRSTDGGLTWSATVATSFRPRSRDGMPVPVLLNNGKEIVYAIEDNGFKNFKPYIIRSNVANNWKAVVGASDVNRTYALSEKIPDSIYAGAPYLRQLKTGETILSYQGTEGRINDMNHSEMKVVIGDDRAMNFNRKTVPFKLAADKSGLWNSLSVLDEYTVAALTSTNNYSTGRGGEVWMIQGQIIPDLIAKKGKIDIDGLENERVWVNNMPIIIAQDGMTELETGFVFDDQCLYAFAQVSERPNASSSIDIYIDPKNKNHTTIEKGVYKFNVSADDKLAVYQGEDGQWATQTATGIKWKAKKQVSAYVVEIAIPWALLGGKPALNKRIGLNVALNASDGYTENISSNEADKPYTWCTLKLK
ncbi:sugar-binding protein [Mucilaginibacter antarcticus]|uniref:Sugar-binding protein n=3 Tax=Mucilaginibacter antarcticus TaxID=1855725 RepID=A0ABW5XRD8_9SPHI